MKIKFLGISADTSAVLMDQLLVLGQEPPFEYFSNLEYDVFPFMPQKEYEVIIHKDFTDDANCAYFFGTASPRNKSHIFNFYLNKFNISVARYALLLHPAASISPSVNLAAGILVEAGVIIAAQSRIGFGVSIKRGCTIGHHNIIGDFTDLNPGVVTSGKITIGSRCTIGTGAVLRDNISIGENTVIGMGSVVTSNIPANCIAYGNPCKVIKEINQN